MISICIPIYNFDVKPLVEKLASQVQRATVPVEIVLIDDASLPVFKQLNEPICSKFRYIELEQNVGRSKIRNLFLEYAQYDYLLFLDCDSMVIADDFIERYLHSVHETIFRVSCGGRVYSDRKPPRSERLKWAYARKRESQLAAIRNQQGTKFFKTGCFLIERELLAEIKFDERIEKYGHEDTLFGFELEKRGIPVLHFDNPVLDVDVERNEHFLQKTENGVQNLFPVLEFLRYEEEFMDFITLIKVFRRLRAYSLLWIFSIVFRFLKPLIYRFLLSGYSSLYCFDLYKLGLFVADHRSRLIALR